jgi:ribosome biogenesis protein YTM1
MEEDGDLETKHEKPVKEELDVVFVTKLNLELPNSEFSVPDHLARYGLSEIVNSLLKGALPKPYDFLIDGQFLRTDLKQYLISKGLTHERRVELEVVEAFPQPSSALGDPHPDWISSIASVFNKMIITGCYDGLIRTFPQQSDQVSLSSGQVCKGHSSAVTAVATFSTDPSMFVSASKDRTTRLWKFEDDASVSPVAVCKGHRESVQAVATQDKKFVTGGWDKTLRVWSVNDILEAPAPKKVKKNTKSVPEAEDATDVYEGHTQCVSALVWPHPAAIYSGSWDMSIRLWDTHKGVTAGSWLGNKSISSLTFSEPGNLLGTGHNDKSIGIWDPRLKEAEVMKLRLRSHEGWVTGVAFSQHDAHLLASCSHDRSVKLWDLRSQLPLHTIALHTDKVMSVAWYGSDFVLSGGSDCKLASHCIHKQS